MPTVDLTPFGFTPTESLAYATLLRLGPTTGYAVAHGARLARATAYAALAGLVVPGTVAAETPTLLVIDDAHLVSAAGAGDGVTCLWSSHPLLVAIARAALE